jgi:hypothetical protein
VSHYCKVEGGRWKQFHPLGSGNGGLCLSEYVQKVVGIWMAEPHKEDMRVDFI